VAIPFHVHYLRGEWEADVDYHHVSPFHHNSQFNITLNYSTSFVTALTCILHVEDVQEFHTLHELPAGLFPLSPPTRYTYFGRSFFLPQVHW
jgi:hypothetical protein